MDLWRSSNARCIGVAVVACAAYVLLPFSGDRIGLGIAAGLVLIGCAVPVLVGVLRRVNTSERPLVDALYFLAALGTLAIVIPSSAYVATKDLSPESFDGLETKIDAVYFTVTTASTVGYGDITADTQGARLLVTMHIVMSIVVLGSMFRLVTRVVGLRVSERRDEMDR